MPEPERIKVQRLAAYTVVVRSQQLLMTQLSQNTGRPGAWTLPGGGIEHGEDPRAAVVRECWEETGLRVQPGRLLDVDSHHVHRDSDDLGRPNDYHAVRLIFAGWVESDDPPRVIEVDGSTSAAAWVPLTDLVDGKYELVPLVAFGLEALRNAAIS